MEEDVPFLELAFALAEIILAMSSVSLCRHRYMGNIQHVRIHDNTMDSVSALGIQYAIYNLCALHLKIGLRTEASNWGTPFLDILTS